MPSGRPSFLAQDAIKTPEKKFSTAQTLSDLDLSAQDQLLLLRKSLQVTVSHLARCASAREREREGIREALLMLEQAFMLAILQLIGRDEKTLDYDYELMLPLRKGGLGL